MFRAFLNRAVLHRPPAGPSAAQAALDEVKTLLKTGKLEEALATLEAIPGTPGVSIAKVMLRGKIKDEMLNQAEAAPPEKISGPKI